MIRNLKYCKWILFSKLFILSKLGRICIVVNLNFEWFLRSFIKPLSLLLLCQKYKQIVEDRSFWILQFKIPLVCWYICWGCNCLRPCSEAKDCQLPNREIKHLRRFEGFVFTFIVDSQNLDSSTKAESGRFSKYLFLFQRVAGNS